MKQTWRRVAVLASLALCVGQSMGQSLSLTQRIRYGHAVSEVSGHPIALAKIAATCGAPASDLVDTWRKRNATVLAESDQLFERMIAATAKTGGPAAGVARRKMLLGMIDKLASDIGDETASKLAALQPAARKRACGNFREKVRTGALDIKVLDRETFDYMASETRGTASRK